MLHGTFMEIKQKQFEHKISHCTW